MANFTFSNKSILFYIIFIICFSISDALYAQGDDCTNAIDLCSVASPYSATTTGMNNDFTVDFGSSSEDMIFYIDLPNGDQITIGQTANSYDSEHELRYGGVCPGATKIVSDDDPDIQNHTWINTTGSTQRVYWLQAGWSTNDGAFTLGWTVTGSPCAPPTCDDPSTLTSSNIGPVSADLGWTENGVATIWDIELGTAGFSPTGIPTANDAGSNPYTYTGLNPSTSYDFYLRADCGALQSNWVGPFNFATIGCNVQIPSSLTATNVFSISADLGWIENGNSTVWDIELGAAGFSPIGVPTANNVTSNPYTYAGLSPSTSYDYYVRADCGGSNSIWVGPFNFTTSSFPTNYTSELISGWARGVVQDPSGNYVWAGYATNSGSDFQIVKTTQGGNIIWSKTIGGTSTEMAFDIVNSGDGGYVIVGHTNSAALIASSNYDIMVTKLDANGGHVWTRVVGTSNSEYSSQCAIIKNTDGTYSIAAITNSDIAFIHLASNGTFIAMKTLNTQSAWGYAVTQATGTNGGWVVAGKYQGPFGSEYMVIKIQTNGAYDWSMIWGDGTGTGEVLYAIVENSPDDYTVFGYTYAEGNTPKNMYAARFTNSGSGPTVSWIKAYGTTEGCGFNDATIASDGNYIVTGSCSSAGGGSFSDTYLMKINATTGAIIWQTEKTDDGTGNRQGDGVVVDASGSYLVAGLGGFDMLKFAPDGSICGGIAGSATINDLGTSFPNYDATEGQSTNTFGVSNASRVPTITDFGTLLPGCNLILPVKLTAFNVSCVDNNVLCEWSTATEINNNYFTVERSDDGFNFEEIGRIQGAGNSNVNHNYRYLDDSPRSGVAYYKLKQTDFDNKFEYFDLRSTNCVSNQEVNIFPNPFNSFIEIEMQEESRSDYTVEIKNYLGQVVFSKPIIKGTSNVKIELGEELTKGIYFIMLFNQNEKLFTKKIIKF